MRKLILWSIIFSIITGISVAQEGEVEKKEPTPLPGLRKVVKALPDISIIGDVRGIYSDDKTLTDRNKIVLKEVELALQGYLYPDIRADVFIGVHRHNSHYHTHVCEGYISFLKTPIKDLIVLAGKKFLPLGKINVVHSHHRNFVDPPEVNRLFFNDSGHGVAGQGINFSYLLPLPFFSQLDLGIWYVDSEHTHGETLGLAEETYTLRSWNSFSLGTSQELEIGLNALKSYGTHFSHHKDKVKLLGVDLTYRNFLESYKKVLFQNEFFWLEREVPEGDLDRFGFYSFLNYRWSKYWDIGIRYDFAETPFPDKEEIFFVSAILTRNLTETTKLRLQYKYDIEEENHTLYLQCIFGIGPHAHPLE